MARVKMLNVFFIAFTFGAPMIAKADTHTLSYIYTRLSGGAASLPAGWHDFTAMGVLDGQVIDYYDSSAKTKVPKKPWMATELSAAYWEEGTRSRKDKERWFKVNMDILRKRMGHNRSEVHVLQWLHGCRGDLQSNGTVAFLGGVDTYSYDGLDFLSFDFRHSEWVATAPAAQETKRKWDEVDLLKAYTHAYLGTQCINWMGDFLKYRHKHAQPAPPASLEVFCRHTRHTPGTLLLSCLASGFAGKHDVTLEIRRNGRTLTPEDGVTSSGVRPNEDDTFQRRDGVEIRAGDAGRFTCVLRHGRLHLEALWDGQISGTPAGGVRDIAIGVGLAGLLAAVAVAVLCWFLYRKLKGGAARVVDAKVAQLLKEESEQAAKQPLYSGSSGSCGSSGSSSEDTSRNSPSGSPGETRVDWPPPVHVERQSADSATPLTSDQ